MTKFKPNKRKAADGEVACRNNLQRAMAGSTMFDAYPVKSRYAGGVDMDSSTVDALADYFHFLHREGIDVKLTVEAALNHWKQER